MTIPLSIASSSLDARLAVIASVLAILVFVGAAGETYAALVWKKLLPERYRSEKWNKLTAEVSAAILVLALLGEIPVHRRIENRTQNASVRASTLLKKMINRSPTTLLSPALSLLTKPTPKDVWEQLQKTRPIQRDAIARGFAGMPIAWKLSFFDVGTKRDNTETLVFRVDEHTVGIIITEVPEDVFSVAKFSNTGDTYVAKGRIKEVTSLSIILDGVELTPALQ